MSTLVTGSKCRLCQKTFRGPEEELGGAMILGEKPKQRVARYIGKLIKHLQEHHPGQMQYYAAQQAEYFGLICLMTFDTSDEAVATERDYLRWTIHKATRRATVTDERIDQKIAERMALIVQEITKLNPELSDTPILVPLLAAFGATFTDILREMRDVLEERGAYPDRLAPTTGESAPAGTSPPKPAISDPVPN